MPRLRRGRTVDFKNLDKYRTGGTGSRLRLSIPVPRAASGRVYRYSPNEHAHSRHFLLGDVNRPEVVTDRMTARMKQEPGHPKTVCPYSGLIANDGQFFHPDDRAAAVETVRHAAISDVRAQISKNAGRPRRIRRRHDQGHHYQLAASTGAPVLSR